MPKKPTAGIPKSPPPVKDRSEEGVFDRYVEKFIKDYQLDSGQIDAARSILREFKSQAEVYRNTKKHAYDDARTKAEKGRREGNLDVVKEAEQKIEELNADISSLFEKMKARLAPIPRESQKKAHEQKTSGSSRGSGSDKGKDAKQADSKSKGRSK